MREIFKTTYDLWERVMNFFANSMKLTLSYFYDRLRLLESNKHSSQRLSEIAGFDEKDQDKYSSIQQTCSMTFFILKKGI